MPFKKGELAKGAIPFKKGESGNPKGRAQQALKIFKTETKYNKQDFKIAVENLFWADKTELTKIINEDEIKGVKIPAVIKMLAGVIWDSVTNRDMSKVRDLIKYIAPTDDELGSIGGQISEIIVRLGGNSGMGEIKGLSNPPEDPLGYSMNEKD